MSKCCLINCAEDAPDRTSTSSFTEQELDDTMEHLPPDSQDELESSVVHVHDGHHPVHPEEDVADEQTADESDNQSIAPNEEDMFDSREHAFIDEDNGEDESSQSDDASKMTESDLSDNLTDDHDTLMPELSQEKEEISDTLARAKDGTPNQASDFTSWKQFAQEQDHMLVFNQQFDQQIKEGELAIEQNRQTANRLRLAHQKTISEFANQCKKQLQELQDKVLDLKKEMIRKVLDS